jgi:hypothetical protein
MQAKRYRVKSVVEAMQFVDGNGLELACWAGKGRHPIANAAIVPDVGGVLYSPVLNAYVYPTNWLIRDSVGRFSILTFDEFAQSYEPAD